MTLFYPIFIPYSQFSRKRLFQGARSGTGTPCILYAYIYIFTIFFRWLDTYFDEIETLPTPNAKGVEFINITKKSLLIFGQAGSKHVSQN